MKRGTVSDVSPLTQISRAVPQQAGDLCSGRRLQGAAMLTCMWWQLSSQLTSKLWHLSRNRASGIPRLNLVKSKFSLNN
ncbi:MAG TPA: hypothetical protein VMV84_06125 [Dehalococcoidales bacterium]|nr:hypothetical protein [Dehalococcoidales bacterium]